MNRDSLWQAGHWRRQLTCSHVPKMTPGQRGQIRTLCEDFSDTLITHEDGYTVSTGLFFIALVSCCRLLGLWEWWPVLCSPSQEKAFCFSSTKHSLMFSNEKTYDNHISAFNHVTCASLSHCLWRTDGLTASLPFSWVTPLLPWTKTAAALSLWCDFRFKNADTTSAKPELFAFVFPCLKKKKKSVGWFHILQVDVHTIIQWLLPEKWHLNQKAPWMIHWSILFKPQTPLHF